MSKKKKKARVGKPKANRKRRNAKGGYSPSVFGILDVAPHGQGFVKVEGMTTDIKIERSGDTTALPGDEVEVVVTKISHTNKRPYGKIIGIKKRAKHIITGRMDITERFAFCIPTDKAYQNDVFITKLPKGLKTGDRVVVEIEGWKDKDKSPSGKIVEVFTGKDEHDVAMKEILLEYGFSLNFPEDVMAETDKMHFEITPEDEKERRDMRDTFTITIDPHDAKDFDDAISYKVLDDGNIEVGVHIADVSHYVRPGTALDREAIERSTSVYLPDRVLPMLPEKISNELCSLRQHEDKFTYSAVFTMDKKYSIKDTWIGRTITHSNHRFTYEEVQDIIEGNDGPHKNEVLAIDKISKHYRKGRFNAGAINFASEEVRFRLDENGDPIEVVVKKSQDSHQLIEELMLLANRKVAEYISEKEQGQEKIPFPYRVHDAPDVEKLIPFTKFAGTFGYKFNLQDKNTIAKSFNEMIVATQKIPEQQILSQLGIRTMSKAIYTTENIGHYGLGFAHYGHFTSPIRRYPDVIAHRVIQATLEGRSEKSFAKKGAETLAKHCSQQERSAMEAERSANKYKQVQFMRQFVGEEFDAVISGVANFGFWCQTTAHLCEGFISVRDFNNEEFKFDEANYTLVGKKSKRSFQIGQAVRIQVVAANLAKRQLDFDLVE